MNDKRKLWSLAIAVFILLVSLVGVAPASAVQSTADVGGFLLPWSGDINLSQGPHAVNGVGTPSYAIDVPGTFDILAPKDGTIVAFNDDMYSLYDFGCTVQAAGNNYLILGHGPYEYGRYDHYTVYYHLSRHSVRDLGLGVDSRVRTGQVIGHTGNTGFVIASKEGTGTHLHFYVTRSTPAIEERSLYHCRNKSDPTQPSTAEEQRGIPTSVNAITYGFEETHNNWPPSINLAASYNRSGGLLGSEMCNIDIPLTKVVLYNHIDYGGECVSVPSPENGYYVPEGMHISSVYLNRSWIDFLQGFYHTLTLWDNDPSDLTSRFTVISNSIPRLETNWNDRVKYVHNASHSSVPWLLEESYSFQAPFNVNLHIRVANDPDFSAWRVCFDGQNCQENAAPINELFYTWNTYGWADGNHIISVQYRRTSDNGNWANADYYENNFYLNPNRQTYAPCGTNTDGARLVSGSDCIIVTTNVADLANANWSDRSNLSITAQGYDVLAYDGSNFATAPYLIGNGQTLNVGSNISSIELRQPLSASYVPTEPLGADGNTIVYLPMDEGNGNQVFSQVGSLTGNLVGSAGFTPGRFGNALHVSNPPEGSGVNFGAQDFGAPMTIEMFVKLDNLNDQRIAAQLGGNTNTGNLKWQIQVTQQRFTVWSCWIHGCHDGYSLETLQTDKWYYLMFTYDGATTTKLYLDSVLQQSINMDGPMPGGATTFEIAKGENVNSCNCTIDDFRISNIVRVPLGPPAPTPTPIPTSTPIPTDADVQTNTPTGTSTPFNGNGQDGDYTVVANETLYTDNVRAALISSANAGQNTISLTSTNGFVVGQEILLMQMAGWGYYEFARISSISSNTLILDQPLKWNYDTVGNRRAQVLQVLHFNSLTIQNGGVVRAHDWDNQSGGIVILRVANTLTIENGGSISVYALGFRGGLPVNPNNQGYNGESQNGSGGPARNPNEGGGGAGGNWGTGAGGGYGTPGENGQSGGSPGFGGNVYGVANLSQIFLGAGGGAGSYNNNSGRGGNGGGIIMLFSRQLNVSGAINANGEQAPMYAPGTSHLADVPGGSGAGGSILVVAESVNIGNNLISAIGGPRQQPPGQNTGGAGGNGRIHIEYGVSLVGSTNPIADTYQDSGLASTSTPTAAFTPLPTNTARSTPTDTATPTFTATFTATYTPSDTATSIPTNTSTLTITPTSTPTIMPSPTYTATSTPTDTSTPTYTPTPTLTPTNTLLPGPVNTGLLNPSSNIAQTGGDNNGYEVNTTYAYANDSLFAVDNNSGTNSNTSCTNSGKDKHRFYNYGISLPGTAVIQGIEVRLDAKVDSSSGSPKLCVQLSWDGGVSWTAVKSTSTLSTGEQTFMLGNPTDTWGRPWTTSQLSNANFRVRMIEVANSTARDFSVDWIAVRVTYR
jgi:hypothetical protein